MGQVASTCQTFTKSTVMIGEDASTHSNQRMGQQLPVTPPIQDPTIKPIPSKRVVLDSVDD